jgi:ABC-type dipeptide/oligopeptide/nickel transport system permease component
MNTYLIKRLLLVIPTVLGITCITFLLMQGLPGDPVRGLAGEQADPEVLTAIRKELGTDRPVLLQYLGYLRLLARGELGRSFYTNRKVIDDLGEKLPNTLILACAAMVFATACGLVLGILMAVRRGTLWDRLGLMLSVSGISLPVFWLGLLLMYVFSFELHLLPATGMGSRSLAFLILPAATLGLNSAAYIARITRTSLLEVLSQPYMVTARAKGLRTGTIIGKHALQNSLIPIITLIGIDFGSYLNGAVLTETIFGWDGVGRYAVEGIFRRDYPVIMGCVLVGAILFILINLAVDLLYGFLDPRIRCRVKNGEFEK